MVNVQSVSCDMVDNRYYQTLRPMEYIYYHNHGRGVLALDAAVLVAAAALLALVVLASSVDDVPVLVGVVPIPLLVVVCTPVDWLHNIWHKSGYAYQERFY